jgi:hypothetical protein
MAFVVTPPSEYRNDTIDSDWVFLSTTQQHMDTEIYQFINKKELPSGDVLVTVPGGRCKNKGAFRVQGKRIKNSSAAEMKPKSAKRARLPAELRTTEGVALDTLVRSPTDERPTNPFCTSGKANCYCQSGRARALYRVDGSGTILEEYCRQFKRERTE